MMDMRMTMTVALAKMAIVGIALQAAIWNSLRQWGGADG
jgi:hypothetical protein